MKLVMEPKELYKYCLYVVYLSILTISIDILFICTYIYGAYTKKNMDFQNDLCA